MTLEKVFTIARKNLGKGSMESSARLCLADAVKLKDDGDWQSAAERALKSIQYSVGIMSSDYQKCRAYVYRDPKVNK